MLSLFDYFQLFIITAPWFDSVHLMVIIWSLFVVSIWLLFWLCPLCCHLSFCHYLIIIWLLTVVSIIWLLFHYACHYIFSLSCHFVVSVLHYFVIICFCLIIFMIFHMCVILFYFIIVSLFNYLHDFVIIWLCVCQ